MARLLSENVKIVQVSTVTAGAAAQTAINTDALDMAGFDGVLWVVPVGTLAAGATTSLKAQQDSASNMGTAEDLAGSGQTIADTDDDKTYYVDLFRPGKRYVRLVVGRGVANSTIGGIVAMQYRARTIPTTHGTGVAGEQHVSPAAGAA